jgi:hypothetical protein
MKNIVIGIVIIIAGIVWYNNLDSVRISKALDILTLGRIECSDNRCSVDEIKLRVNKAKEVAGSKINLIKANELSKRTLNR